MRRFSVSSLARRPSKCNLGYRLSVIGVGSQAKDCSNRTRYAAMVCVSISIGNGRRASRERTTLGSDDASLSQGVVKKLEVRLLKQALGGALRVRRVGNDDIEGVLVVVEELETVANVHLNFGVLETLGHAGQVLLREADHGLVRTLMGHIRDQEWGFHDE